MMRALVLAVALAAAMMAGPAAALTVRILPEAPIAEPVSGGQAFNFDVVVHNDETAPAELVKFETSYLDASGAVLLWREANRGGAIPAIATIPDRQIAPGVERLFFNPFPLAPSDMRIARVRVRLTFSHGQSGETAVEAEAPVSPRTPPVMLMPVAGRVLTWDGHDLMGHHRRWDHTVPFLRGLGFASNGMRYSYDFVVVDEQGRHHRDGATRNVDWFSFGVSLRAPADGVVVRAVSHHPDDRSFDPETSHADINALFGNYLVIDHGDGVFSLMGHLKQNSLAVAEGERVRGGQAVAAIGNSGSSEFPHLHFQLMDGPDMRGEGVPALFRDFARIRGAEQARVREGPVEAGEVVEVR